MDALLSAPRLLLEGAGILESSKAQEPCGTRQVQCQAREGLSLALRCWGTTGSGGAGQGAAGS